MHKEANKQEKGGKKKNFQKFLIFLNKAKKFQIAISEEFKVQNPSAQPLSNEFLKKTYV